MREPFDLMRELKRGAFGETSNAEGAWRSWALYFGVAAAAGAFLAFVGAFGTEAYATRYAYWLTAIIGGAIVGQAARFAITNLAKPSTPLWLICALIALIVSIPGVLFVEGLRTVFFGKHFSWESAVSLTGAVAAISGAMTALFFLLGTARVRATKPGPAPPRFLDRLPPKLRGAALYAVEAEDHYLRLHTSKGQDLILLRLTDAIAELDGLEGLQPHRSWWVARDGLADVKRADGKVTLILKDGAEAPVARGAVRALKEAGWI